jgi:hypothetical protein
MGAREGESYLSNENIQKLATAEEREDEVVRASTPPPIAFLPSEQTATQTALNCRETVTDPKDCMRDWVRGYGGLR